MKLCRDHPVQPKIGSKLFLSWYQHSLYFVDFKTFSVALSSSCIFLVSLSNDVFH